HSELAAEATAERRARDADLRDRYAIDLRQVGAGPEGRLRARSHRDTALALRPRDRDLWFEVALVHPGGAEAALDDGGALGEHRVGVALLVGHDIDDVR